MKKILSLVALSSCALLQAACDSRVQVGANYGHMYYKPVGEESFDGTLSGLQGIYEYMPLDNLYAGAQITWQQGTLNGSPGSRDITYVDTQERIGYSFGLDCGWSRITLFSGFGFHYLQQNLKPDSAPQIDFRYSEFYIPVGFAIDTALFSCFNVGVNCTWMPQVFSTVGLKPLQGAYWTLTNSLRNMMVEIPLDFSVTSDDRFHILLVPFFQYWQDGGSTAITTTGIPLGLPENHYDTYGVNLNIAYRF